MQWCMKILPIVLVLINGESLSISNGWLSDRRNCGRPGVRRLWRINTELAGELLLDGACRGLNRCGRILIGDGDENIRLYDPRVSHCNNLCPPRSEFVRLTWLCRCVLDCKSACKELKKNLNYICRESEVN